MQEFKDKPLYLKFIDDLAEPRVASTSARAEQFKIMAQGNS
jgi:hypothetical protein